MRVGNRVKKHIFNFPFPFTGKRPSRSSSWKDKDIATTITATTTTTDKYYNDNDVVHISEDECPGKGDTPSSLLSDNDSISIGSKSSNAGSSRQSNRKHTQTVRIVSWQLGDMTQTQSTGSRWTVEQERELVLAQQELARCQKAWSSEQEVWLKHIETLNSEKEAHEDFLNLRAKQQDDERVYFRKACGRRRSSEGGDQDADSDSDHDNDNTDSAANNEGLRRNQSQSQRRFRRLRRGS